MSRRISDRWGRIAPGLVVMVALVIAPAWARSEDGAKGRFKGPLQITSERMFADNAKQLVIFTGKVVARNDEMTLRADKMDVFYDEGGELSRVIAESNVELTRQNGILTSKRAVYEAGSQEITFTGDPRAIEGKNMVTGDVMIYFIETDRYEVKNPTVIMENR